jgi:integrase
VRKVLTDRYLKNLKPALPGKRSISWDVVVPGLGIRVTDKGHKTFVLGARFPGAKHFAPRELGEYGALRLDQARDWTRQWLALITAGIDPREHAEEQKLTEQRRRKNSFAAVTEDFLRMHVIGPNPAHPLQRKGREVERDIRREFIARWGKRPIDSITPHDIVAVIDEVVARGSPYQARNLYGYAQRIFNWAIGRGVYGINTSPLDRLKPRELIGEKRPRTRTLNDLEIAAFWRVAQRLGYPYGPLFQLLLLTGQRKSEIAEARWREIDLKARLIVVPAARVKGDAPHVVPLVADAMRIIEALPRFMNGDYLFSTTGGATPVNGFSKAKLRLDRLMFDEVRKENPEALLTPFVIHDLRRTMRTGLSALPIPDLVRELVIGHAKPGLHKVYDQYAYLSERTHAAALWAQKLRSIVDLPSDAKIFPIRPTSA